MQGSVPIPRDDHSLSTGSNNNIIIFGGFVNGARVNDVYQLDFVANAASLNWTKFDFDKAKSPLPRASHSSIIHENKLYVFGGQDDENNKLGDMWQFDFTTSNWT